MQLAEAFHWLVKHLMRTTGSAIVIASLQTGRFLRVYWLNGSKDWPCFTDVEGHRKPTQCVIGDSSGRKGVERRVSKHFDSSGRVHPPSLLLSLPYQLILPKVDVLEELGGPPQLAQMTVGTQSGGSTSIYLVMKKTYSPCS